MSKFRRRVTREEIRSTIIEVLPSLCTPFDASDLNGLFIERGILVLSSRIRPVLDSMVGRELHRIDRWAGVHWHGCYVPADWRDHGPEHEARKRERSRGER